MSLLHYEGHGVGKFQWEPTERWMFPGDVIVKRLEGLEATASDGQTVTPDMVLQTILNYLTTIAYDPNEDKRERQLLQLYRHLNEYGIRRVVATLDAQVT